MNCGSNQSWEDIALENHQSVNCDDDDEDVNNYNNVKMSNKICHSQPNYINTSHHYHYCNGNDDDYYLQNMLSEYELSEYNSNYSSDDDNYKTPPASLDHLSDDNCTILSNNDTQLVDDLGGDGNKDDNLRKSSLIDKLLTEIHLKLKQTENRRLSDASSLSTSDFNRKPNIRRHSLIAKSKSINQ